MIKDDKKKVLENHLAYLEGQNLIQEVNVRVWRAESLMKANTQNTAILTQEQKKQEILEKQIAKTKELLAEIEGS